jgi:hypothetical protein
MKSRAGFTLNPANPMNGKQSASFNPISVQKNGSKTMPAKGKLLL